jgi:hypothetical protein
MHWMDEQDWSVDDEAGMRLWLGMSLALLAVGAVMAWVVWP